ncbi:MAG TPA: hypothetical protein VIM98_15880, partial [Dyella sp.]|uniref:hypothetical protein n=1 Tax=Dyella sp. TaxID=1869338 RepID=UPI002F95E649
PHPLFFEAIEARSSLDDIRRAAMLIVRILAQGVAVHEADNGQKDGKRDPRRLDARTAMELVVVLGLLEEWAEALRPEEGTSA